MTWQFFFSLSVSVFHIHSIAIQSNSIHSIIIQIITCVCVRAVYFVRQALALAFNNKLIALRSKTHSHKTVTLNTPNIILRIYFRSVPPPF